MKNTIFILLSIFILTACQQEGFDNQINEVQSRSANYGLAQIGIDLATI